MCPQHKVLAIIPARSGSKRLPNKNKLKLDGKPIICWTIEAAKNSKYITDVLLSTDDSSIKELGEEYGLLNNGLRPEMLSSDTAKIIDVVKYELSKVGNDYDVIILLQPTSPLRTTAHINEALELHFRKNNESTVSVCECEHPPHWSAPLSPNGTMENFSRDNNKRSQDLTVHYRLNGALYIYNTNTIKENNRFILSEKTNAYIMPNVFSVDIDTLMDFKLAEVLVKEIYG